MELSYTKRDIETLISQRDANKLSEALLDVFGYATLLEGRYSAQRAYLVARNEELDERKEEILNILKKLSVFCGEGRCDEKIGFDIAARKIDG